MTVVGDIDTVPVMDGFAVEKRPVENRDEWVCQECGKAFRAPELLQEKQSLKEHYLYNQDHLSAVSRNKDARRGRMSIGAVVEWGDWCFLHRCAEFDPWLRYPEEPLSADDLDDLAERIADAPPLFGMPTFPDHAEYFLRKAADRLRHAARALRLSQATSLAWHLALKQTEQDPAPAHP